jgi:TRAP transporter TAXI family solute receptor
VYAKNPDSHKKKPIKPKKPKKTRSSRDSWVVYGTAIILTALVFFFTYQFVEPAPPTEITIASGRADGAYHQFALQFKEKLAQHGINLTIRNTSGSVENVALLNNAKQAVDLAFIQGGVSKVDKHTQLVGLGSLYLEPVWVFSTKALTTGRLSDLAGQRISIGSVGSGSRAIATQLLEDNHLLDKVELINLGESASAEALRQQRISSVIVVASHQSPTVQALLNNPKLHLFSFARADAYAQHYSFLSKLRLPQGAVNLARNIPPSDTNLIAPAAMLIAKQSLHPALSDLMMQITTELFSSGDLFTEKGMFPSPKYLDYPLSSEAKRFYKSGPPFLQRFLPFWAASLIDRLKVLLFPLIALLIPLSKILPPTYRWSVRKRIYNWYEELQIVDQSASEIVTEDNLELCLANLDKIETEIKEVEVPLSYAYELYVLRQHVDLLARQISAREKEAEKQRLINT